MMKGIFALLAIAVVATAVVVAGEDDKDSKVVVLTDDNFDEKTKEGIWLIKFYAPWCGHCKRLAPTWDELAGVAGDNFNVAKIDCTVHKTIAERFKIRGYPTLKLIENGGDAVDVNVPRTIPSFVRFVIGKAVSKDLSEKFDLKALEAEEAKRAPPPKPKAAPAAAAAAEGAAKPKAGAEFNEPEDSKVISLTSDNFDEKIKKGNWLVKFYAPWCGHCKRLAPTWTELSKVAGESFNVGRIDCVANKDICSKYEIRGYPTLLYFAEGAKEHTPYSGARTVEAFTKFVADQKAAAGGAAAADADAHTEL